jgi:hypothetical protein
MRIVVVSDVFVGVVDKLMRVRAPDGGKFYVETKGGRYINFKPKAFRKILGETIGKDAMKEYLIYFRKLRYIIVCSEDKFTNIQWIGKSVRVITVDREIYETLKELIRRED